MYGQRKPAQLERLGNKKKVLQVHQCKNRKKYSDTKKNQIVNTKMTLADVFPMEIHGENSMVFGFFG